MKQTLLNSSVTRGLLSLFFLMAMVGNVWGDTATSSSLSSKSTSAQTVEAGKTITYTCSSSNDYSNPARIYKNSKFTVSSTDGATITKIELTSPSGYPANAFTANVGSYSATTTAGTWTGEATSIVFTAGAQVRVSAITVTYSAAAATATAPTLPTSCSFTSASYDVTITNKETGATVYYTTDGSDPTTSSTSFTGESTTFSINATTTVKAMAVIDGKTNSSVATATYTKEVVIANTAETAYTTAEAIALIDAGNSQLSTTEVYVKGTVSKVDTYNSNYGSITYWLDENTFEIYGGLGLEGAMFAAATDIQVDDEVVVKGIIKKFGTTYEMDKNNVLISRKTNATQTTPTLTLGTYKTMMTLGSDDNEYTVTTNSDGAVSVTSSDEEVAEAIVVDGTVLVTAKKVGTATITVSVAETATYYAANKQYTLSVIEAASLPFAFNSGVANIAKTTGMSQYGLGTDYTSSPALKIDHTGDYVLINFEGVSDKPMYLVYTIKGNSYSGSTFEVQESADCTNFTTIKKYTTMGNATTEVFTLASTTNCVKFVYTKKSGGNVALGDIKIGAGYARSVTKGAYGTICLPYAVEAPAGATFSSITGVEADGTTLTLTPAASLEAGKPYIFEATASEVICNYSGDAASEPADDNYLVGTFAGMSAPQGSYVLQCQNKVYGFYQVATSTINVGANRAYLKAPATEAKAFFFTPADTETGLDQLNTQTTQQGNAIYNLAGQRVNKAQKGIYIINGKKILK